MSRTVDIACLQTRPMPDFDSALAEALELSNRALSVGAEFVALPEYCGGLKSDGARFVPPVSREEDHPVLAGLVSFAKEKHVWMLVGSLAIKTSRGETVNRSILIDDDGKIVSRYDKIHMFDIDLPGGVSYRESDTITAGDKAVVVDTPFGRIGHSICYDLRFPQLYRRQAEQGAEILFIPAAFTKKTGEAHWHILNRARAIENGAFVVSPCAIGAVEGGGESYGHSLIVDPWGDVKADGGEFTGVVHTQIDLDQVAVARNRIPSLVNGREFSVETSAASSARAVA